MDGTEGFEPSTTSTPCSYGMISRSIIEIQIRRNFLVNKGCYAYYPLHPLSFNINPVHDYWYQNRYQFNKCKPKANHKEDPIMNPLEQKSQIIIYQTEDGRTKIDVQLSDETVWLTQPQMAELFQTTQQNISQHINNIFEENELAQNATRQAKRSAPER